MEKKFSEDEYVLYGNERYRIDFILRLKDSYLCEITKDDGEYSKWVWQEVLTKIEEPRDTVYWIVTEGNDPDICADGEFGVEVNGRAYLYYKYDDPSPSNPDVKYRRIHKREFGEVIQRPKRY